MRRKGLDPARATAIIVVSALLGLALTAAMPTTFGSGPMPVTITTSPNAGATKADTDHKLISAQGLYWLFFLAKNVEYSTSPNGTSWSKPTVVSSACGDGENFDVYFDPPSGEIFFAQAFCGTGTFSYGVATPRPGGALTWATHLTTVNVPQANGTYGVSRPTIRPDSLGHLFVAFEASVAKGSSSSYHVMVYEKSLGSWSLVFDYDTHQGSTDWMGSMQEFTAGKMSLYYGTVNGGWTGYIQDWSGSAWGPQIVFPGTSRLEPMNGGGLTLGDTLYWAGFNYDDDGVVGFFKHAYGNTSVPNITSLESDPLLIKDGEGCLGSNGNQTLAAFYASAYGYGPADTVFYRVSTDLGVSWGPEQILTNGETGIQGKTLQCSSISSIGEVQVAWTSGAAAPYQVRFADVADIAKQVNSSTTSSSFTTNTTTTATKSTATSSTTRSTSRSSVSTVGTTSSLKRTSSTTSSLSQSVSGNGGAIPEFPFVTIAVVSFTLLIVGAYLSMRKARP
jgi:hypothetical protein